MEVRKSDNIKKGDEFLGNRVRAKVVKNKVAPPFKTAEFDIMYGEGISRISGIVDAAANADIINKAGSWYSYEGERMGQGRDAAKAFLEADPKILREVELKVREHYNLNIPKELKEDVTLDEKLLEETQIEFGEEE